MTRTVARPSVLRLNAADNVAIAMERLAPGAQVEVEQIAVIESIPSGHKLATRPIAQGEAVLKYGQVIGEATRPIGAGAHVHVHNLAVSDLRQAAQGLRISPRSERPRSFEGFRRPNGKVGVRNYVGVLT